jgi:uncharacterized protein (DUF2336 family)
MMNVFKADLNSNRRESLPQGDRLTVTQARSGGVSPITEELAALLPRTSESVATLCAKKLVQAGMMTPCLVDLFVRRQDRSSLVVLSEDVALADETALRLAQTGSAIVARALAARNDLTDHVIMLLLGRNDPVIDQTLAEHAGAALPDSALNALALRALGNVALARQVLSRSDLPARTRAVLFNHANPRQRIGILRNAEAFASQKLALVMAESLDDVRAAIEGGDATRLTRSLSATLNIPHAFLFSLLGESSGALLAIALTAVDTPEALIRKACTSPSFSRAGMPGGVEDVLETTSAGAARWIMAAYAALSVGVLSSTSLIDTPPEASERLIA